MAGCAQPGHPPIFFLLRAAYKPKNFRANSAKYGANGSAHGARGSDNFDQLLV